MDPRIAALAQPLTVGDVCLPNRVLLAPMSGVSDRPFREMAAEHGAGAVVSEMIASDQLACANAVAAMKAERAGPGPHIIQLAGREARWMAEGARAATGAGADIIDINMGCPAKKVTNGYSGSALMRDLDQAIRLIDAAVAATSRPVTLKIRLGWDERTVNASELARRAEGAGVKMVTVHGRTRCQFFRGEANWKAIARVKSAVGIPVVANGDIRSIDDLGRLMNWSQADAVMIGRATYGKPWLPGQISAFAATGRRRPLPSGLGLRDLVMDHYRRILGFYGHRLGVRTARKHLGWYLDGLSGVPATAHSRRRLMTETRPAAVAGLIQDLFNAPPVKRAA